MDKHTKKDRKWKIHFTNHFRTEAGYTKFLLLPTIEFFTDKTFETRSTSIGLIWLFWELSFDTGWWVE